MKIALFVYVFKQNKVLKEFYHFIKYPISTIANSTQNTPIHKYIKENKSLHFIIWRLEYDL